MSQNSKNSTSEEAQASHLTPSDHYPFQGGVADHDA
jgi:hypothetical protein